MQTTDTTELQRVIARLIERYGSIRKAAEATGINFVYLHRLHTGEKVNPSDEVLLALGLERIITYKRVKRC